MATVWVANWPLSSTLMCGSTEQIRTNWDAIEDWWAVEHGGITSATSGQHSIGRTGVLLTSTTSGISSVSSPGTGSLALNTTLGEMQLYRYDSANLTAGWEGITDQKFARIRKGTGNQSIPATAWTQVVCAGSVTNTYDGLSEWASYRYTAVGDGYFLVSVIARWPSTSSEYNKAIAIYKNGSAVAIKRLYGSVVLNMRFSDILSLVATDYVQVFVWHDHTSAVTLDSTTIYVSRVS